MDYWEFRATVRRRGGVAAKDEDFHLVEMMISEMFGRGWSATDTARYIKASEYGSPDLDEDIGIARMLSIEKKYLKQEIQQR